MAQCGDTSTELRARRTPPGLRPPGCLSDPGRVLPPLHSLSCRSFSPSPPPPRPAPLSPRFTPRCFLRVRNEAERSGNWTQDAIAGAPGSRPAEARRGGARGWMGGRRGRSIAFRLPRAPTALSPCLQLGARGPAAPGCAPLAGLHSDAAGAPGTPSSAASPGGRGLKASRGILRATKETWFLQPLASASLHTPPRDLGGGGGLGRERGWRRSGLKGSVGTRRKGLRDLEKPGAGAGAGMGVGVGREPLPF
uniref:Uncharacterized protein n=1 Tax=Myotis myotis TaxID=51298 RepID=A0A7J8AIW0_MYOMY|nr:hypothetical protein mMyoMyo1_002093 [Myotis myotis]